MGPQGFTLSLFQAFFADDYNWRVIGNTLRIAALVTLVCSSSAIPSPSRSPGRAPDAGAAADRHHPAALRRRGRQGLRLADRAPARRAIAKLLVATGVWDEPQRLLFTEPGLVIGAANVFLPFMILPIYSVVKLIDPRLSKPRRRWAPARSTVSARWCCP